VAEPDGFAAFAAALAVHFDWPAPPSADARIVEDLGLDSVEMLEIVLALEELAGHEVPQEAIAAATTVGDLWAMACRYRHHRQS
jgi:acyl carrier protein